jgi:large subunit ribosomal protein L21
MFAVIKTAGKQYRVAADEVLKLAVKLGEPGEIVTFGEVLVVGGDNQVLGTPTVAGASVAGEVLEHTRGRKIITLKKRRRKNSKRKRGYRQDFTLVRITEILTDGKKPSVEAQEGGSAGGRGRRRRSGRGPEGQEAGCQEGSGEEGGQVGRLRRLLRRKKFVIGRIAER